MQARFIEFLNSHLCFATIAGGFVGIMLVSLLIPRAPAKVRVEETETIITETAYIESESIVITKETQADTKIMCQWGGFSITQEEFELICRTTYCESGNQDINTQIMVALTILNRVAADKFPDDVGAVVYQENQYEVTNWKDFENYQWTESVEQAVTYALEVNNYPLDMYYFRTSHFHRFGQPYIRSNDLYFNTEG